jgi:hypothetical protein
MIRFRSLCIDEETFVIGLRVGGGWFHCGKESHLGSQKQSAM